MSANSYIFPLLRKAHFIAVTALAISGLQAAVAQVPNPLPQRSQVDSRGVDLVSGYLFISGVTDVAIGDSSAGGLAYTRSFYNGGWRGNTFGSISSSGSTFSVTIGGSTDVFTQSGSSFTDEDARGATLAYSEFCTTDGETGITTCAFQRYTYTSPDGVVANFNKMLTGGSGFPASANQGILTGLSLPDGEVISYHYKEYTLPGGSPPARNTR